MSKAWNVTSNRSGAICNEIERESLPSLDPRELALREFLRTDLSERPSGYRDLHEPLTAIRELRFQNHGGSRWRNATCCSFCSERRLQCAEPRDLHRLAADFDGLPLPQHWPELARAAYSPTAFVRWRHPARPKARFAANTGPRIEPSATNLSPERELFITRAIGGGFLRRSISPSMVVRSVDPGNQTLRVSDHTARDCRGLMDER